MMVGQQVSTTVMSGGCWLISLVGVYLALNPGHEISAVATSTLVITHGCVCSLNKHAGVLLQQWADQDKISLCLAHLSLLIRMTAK